MTEVIAFSGVHNTGKSFALEKIRTQCEQEGQLIFVMKETARMLLPLLGVDQARMQQGMNRIELERIQYLQKLKDLGIFDKILVDRTLKDNIGYSKFLKEQGVIPQELEIQDNNACPYDKIIFFQEGIKNSKHRDPKGDMILSKALLETISQYPTDIKYFRNFMEDEEEVIKVINGNSR